MSNEDEKWVVPSWTYDDVKALRPCKPGFQSATALLGGKEKWNAKAVTLSELKVAGVNPVDIIWLATEYRGSSLYTRRLHLWASDCAAHVLSIFTTECPGDRRPTAAIKASRLVAKGELEIDAYSTIADHAWDAAWEVSQVGIWATSKKSARAAASAAYAGWCWDAAEEAAAAVPSRERTTERLWQLDRLILWMESQEEPEVWPI